MFHLPPSSCAVLTIEVLRHLQILVFVLNLSFRCHTVKMLHHCQGRSIHLEWETQHLKVFSQNNLTGHKCIHTGKKIYHCDICGKALIRNFNLKAYKRIHTKETQSQYVIFGKSFSRNNSLTDHKRIRSNIVC
ncbi:---NA--- [Octopus vulgaris]|uniref:---NA n=1 Tax=Octopus vulgaris TaxID=6645 RepID=A0AA36BDX4_OCTVU|nr:---NA--- [Octopus vulgaris]